MATSTVSSPREIELADHKLGSFFSDLDIIETTIEKLVEPMTVEAYLVLDENEREGQDREPAGTYCRGVDARADLRRRARGRA